MQNARKWFATCELERLSQDREWLDKAIRIMEKHVQDANRKQRGKAPDGCLGLICFCGRRLRLEVNGDNLRLLCGERIFLPLLLPVVERRHGDLSPFGVGVVHGFGVVPQRLLSEALREAAFERAFSPRVAIAVERHALDLQTSTALPELRSAIARAHGAEIREQRAGLRPALQDSGDFLAEAD